MPFDVLVPENFNAAEYVKDIKGKSREHVHDGLNIFLSFIIEGMTQKSRMEDYLETGYVRLYSKILKYRLGDNYLREKEILLANNIIECDNMAGKGWRSMGFRLMPAYITNTKVVQVTNITLINKRTISQQEQRSQKRQIDKELGYLTKWLSPEYIQLNREAAFYYVENQRRTLLNTLNSMNISSNNLLKALRFKINSRYSVHNAYLRNFEFYTQRYSRDDAGRFYNVLSGMTKELRNFITFGGAKLCSLDISASQPYLLQVLQNKKNWEINNPNTPIQHNLTNKPTIHKLIMLLDSHENQSQQGIQHERFSNINWESGFYEYIVELVRQKYEDKPERLGAFRDRIRVKKMIMPVFFDLIETYRPANLQDSHIVFHELFPFEMSILDILKEDSPKTAAKILQSVEAYLVTKVTCKKIAEAYPQIPLYTVHDCILTTDGNQELVESCFRQVLHDHTGKPPGIKVSILDESIIDQNKMDSRATELLENWRNKLRGEDTSEFPDTIVAKPAYFKIPSYNGRQILSTKYLDPEKPYLDVDE